MTQPVHLTPIFISVKTESKCKHVVRYVSTRLIFLLHLITDSTKYSPSWTVSRWILVWDWRVPLWIMILSIFPEPPTTLNLVAQPLPQKHTKDGGVTKYPDTCWIGMKDSTVERTDALVQPLSARLWRFKHGRTRKTDQHSFSLTLRTHSHMCTGTGH